MASAVASRVRTVVSSGRRRYVVGDIDLDLSYISPTLIATSLPAQKNSVEGIFRNPLSALCEMLERTHGHENVMIWNLSGREYNSDFATPRSLLFGFEDHHAPPFALLVEIVLSIDAWLQAAPGAHIGVVHCVGGKGRTGTICSVYLFFSGQQRSFAAAAEHYLQCRSRSGNRLRAGITRPSQLRFARYFERLATAPELPRAWRFQLQHVVMSHMSGSGPYVLEVCRTLSDDSFVLFRATSRAYGRSRSAEFAVTLPLALAGDLQVRCRDAAGRELFRVMFHTAFLFEDRSDDAEFEDVGDAAAAAAAGAAAAPQDLLVDFDNDDVDARKGVEEEEEERKEKEKEKEEEVVAESEGEEPHAFDRKITFRRDAVDWTCRPLSDEFALVLLVRMRGREPRGATPPLWETVRAKFRQHQVALERQQPTFVMLDPEADEAQAQAQPQQQQRALPPAVEVSWRTSPTVGVWRSGWFELTPGKLSCFKPRPPPLSLAEWRAARHRSDGSAAAATNSAKAVFPLFNATVKRVDDLALRVSGPNTGQLYLRFADLAQLDAWWQLLNDACASWADNLDVLDRAEAEARVKLASLARMQADAARAVPPDDALVRELQQQIRSTREHLAAFRRPLPARFVEAPVQISQPQLVESHGLALENLPAQWQSVLHSFGSAEELADPEKVKTLLALVARMETAFESQRIADAAAASGGEEPPPAPSRSGSCSGSSPRPEPPKKPLPAVPSPRSPRVPPPLPPKRGEVRIVPFSTAAEGAVVCWLPGDLSVADALRALQLQHSAEPVALLVVSATDDSLLGELGGDDPAQTLAGAVAFWGPSTRLAFGLPPSSSSSEEEEACCPSCEAPMRPALGKAVARFCNACGEKVAAAGS